VPPLFDFSNKTFHPNGLKCRSAAEYFYSLGGDNPGHKLMLRDALLQIGLAVFVAGTLGGMLYFEAVTLMAAAPF
jgi:hypothetical protein